MEIKIRPDNVSTSILNSCYLKTVIIFLSLFLLGASHYTYDGEGKAAITPEEMPISLKDEFTIKFTVGEHGINAGGGIKARFLRRWRTQIENKEENNFLTVDLSRKESGYKVAVKNMDGSLDGQVEKNSYIITITITEKPLVKGDVISLTTSRTFSRDFHAFTEALPVASDTNGDGKFALIKDFPRITVRPDPPERIYAVIPSTEQAGREFDLKIAILDKYNNAAEDYTGTIEFSSSDEKAKLPEPYFFVKEDRGIKRFPVTVNTPGFHTITVSDKSRNWIAHSNPINSQKTLLKERIWWGDMHSHSEISFDGKGNSSHRYARDVAGLDFYALTDHVGLQKAGFGITDKEWDFIKEKTIEFYEPGKFVTILGYESSLPVPSGHHNIYYNSSNELIQQIPLIRRAWKKTTILTIWEYLKQRIPEGVDVITIPHNTELAGYKGISSREVLFGNEYDNPEMRVAIEIFSRHGSSERYDPSSKLSFNNSLNPDVELPRKRNKSVLSAQKAWARKSYIGVIASSDDHNAHPGMPLVNHKEVKTTALAAVYSKELTRDSIFNAIKSRNTYGTTGKRIILDYSLNGFPMGSLVVLSKRQRPAISVTARGTDLIDFIEVLKWDFNKGEFDNKGHPIFETIVHEEIKALDTVLEFTDKDFTGFSMYYIRLRQIPEPGGQEEWAWSSPIWVKSINN